MKVSPAAAEDLTLPGMGRMIACISYKEGSMAHRFDHGHIKSRDPQRTAQWWADAFGAKLLPEFSSGEALFCPIEIGGVKINISRPGPAEAANMEAASAAGHFGLEHLGLETDDLDADLTRLRKDGLAVFEVRETPTSRIAFVETPDAVRVELMERKGDG
jgi:catechol 2,3-dioxygenase-like lactoylglutathione lyase family enzyme